MADAGIDFIRSARGSAAACDAGQVLSVERAVDAPAGFAVYAGTSGCAGILNVTQDGGNACFGVR